MSRAAYKVLKFGGSVLHSQDDFPRVKKDIQGFVDKGIKTVAVVSAYFGVTERLIEQASADNIDCRSEAYAQQVGRGEHESAQELTHYLQQSGFQTAYVTPRAIDFLASGERAAASPVSLCSHKLHTALNLNDVIVLPGFSAVNEQGESVLLGRGGSDISAVCVAEALGLQSVRLLKDVDALYDRDPNQFPDAQPLAHVDYQTALLLGGELIQAEAIEFAASKGISIEVAAIGQACGSRIGLAPINEQAQVSACG